MEGGGGHGPRETSHDDDPLTDLPPTGLCWLGDVLHAQTCSTSSATTPGEPSREGGREQAPVTLTIVCAGRFTVGGQLGLMGVRVTCGLSRAARRACSCLTSPSKASWTGCRGEAPTCPTWCVTPALSLCCCSACLSRSLTGFFLLLLCVCGADSRRHGHGRPRAPHQQHAPKLSTAAAAVITVTHRPLQAIGR